MNAVGRDVHRTQTLTTPSTKQNTTDRMDHQMPIPHKQNLSHRHPKKTNKKTGLQELRRQCGKHVGLSEEDHIPFTTTYSGVARIKAGR